MDVVVDVVVVVNGDVEATEAGIIAILLQRSIRWKKCSTSNRSRDAAPAPGDRMRMRTSAPVVALASLLLACEPSDPAGRACTADSECGALACLDGRCAPALDDPGGAPAPEGGSVRVIAVGLHPTLADVETQAAWRAFVERTFDAEVAPRVATDRPTLVVLPENAALMASFIGARGAEGRAATTSEEAILAVLTGQSAAAVHYVNRTSASLAAGRLVGLAVTDTVWRALAPFEDGARTHGVWVAVTTNVADAERRTDAALVAALVDEAETDRSFAWEASSDDVFNQTLVWSPEGELVHRWRKAYLVPIEEAADGLALSSGALDALRAHDLPFGRVASVISKDAWMPDVLDRLALEGTALMLQPEAFSGWGIPHGEDGAWAPDVVKESGWAHVARYPEFRASVLPCLSQNLFELVFDCQSSVIAGRAPGAWIGQDADAGFAAVAPWVVADDGVGTLEERRARLIAEGMRLVPGGDREDAYPAGSASLDLDLSNAMLLAGPGGIAESASGEQRRPVVTIAGGRAVLLWEDERNGRTRIYGALARDDGSFGEARVRVRTDGEVRALRAVTLGESVHLVWQEAEGATWIAKYARSEDGGRSFGAPTAIAGGPEGAAYVPDVAVDADGTVWAAWIELVGGAGRVRVASRGPSDAGFGAAIDLEPPPAAYRTRENRWAPSIAVEAGRVAVAWASFETFAWDLRGAFGGAAGFGAPVRLDDASVPFETIHSDPRVAWVDGAVLVAWTDLRVRRPDHDVRARRIDPDDVAGSPPSVSLASTDAAARPQWRPAVAARGADVAIAWQDFRTSHNELRIARSTDGGRTFGADELLAPGGDRYYPTAAVSDAQMWIAYETVDRGPRRVDALRLP